MKKSGKRDWSSQSIVMRRSAIAACIENTPAGSHSLSCRSNVTNDRRGSELTSDLYRAEAWCTFTPQGRPRQTRQGTPNLDFAQAPHGLQFRRPARHERLRQRQKSAARDVPPHTHRLGYLERVQNVFLAHRLNLRRLIT